MRQFVMIFSFDICVRVCPGAVPPAEKRHTHTNTRIDPKQIDRDMKYRRGGEKKKIETCGGKCICGTNGINQLVCARECFFDPARHLRTGPGKRLHFLIAIYIYMSAYKYLIRHFFILSFFFRFCLFTFMENPHAC